MTHLAYAEHYGGCAVDCIHAAIARNPHIQPHLQIGGQFVQLAVLFTKLAVRHAESAQKEALVRELLADMEPV